MCYLSSKEKEVQRIVWFLTALFLKCPIKINRGFRQLGDKLKLFRNPRLWDYIAVNAEDNIQAGGWYSSFDGEPFTAEEMKQYADNTVEKLRPYLSKNKSVVEIGCASGLTMFRIAPFVGEYLGTDMAKVNLRRNAEYIKANSISNITLIQCTADKIAENAGHLVDIIIINSVCQYFPGMDYFEEVIGKCISVLKPGGVLYLGDLLDKNLLPVFLSELKAWKMQHQIELGNADDRADELWIARDYFDQVNSKFERIKDVIVSDKIGTIANELTKYRYDTIIRV